MNRLIAAALVSLAVLLALPALTGGLGVGMASVEGGLGPYYKVVIGTDFDAIDSDDVIRFASGTGGGVWVSDRPHPGASYLEAAVDLPSGAEVTRVTFYLRNCEPGLAFSPLTYFGAYAPETGAFTYHVPETFMAIAQCNATITSSFDLDPAVTIDNSDQRYVVGYKTDKTYPSVAYSPDDVKQVIVGARLTYQLPGVFLPSVQR